MSHVLVMPSLSAQQETLDSCAGSRVVDDEEAGQSPGGHSAEVCSTDTPCCDHISLHEVYISSREHLPLHEESMTVSSCHLM